MSSQNQRDRKYNGGHLGGGGMGAEIQASEVRPGEKTWGDCVETAWVVGLQSGATATEGVRRGSLGCLGGPAPLFGGCLRGGAGPVIVAFSPACVIANCTGSRRHREPPPLPSHTPGVCLSCHHCRETQDWSPAATSAHP